jgi:predicted acetyltransferase
MSVDQLPHEWDLRVPTPDQLKAFMAPTQLAFAEPSAGPEIEDWARLLEPDRWLSAFEGPDSIVPLGSTAALSLRLTVPGGEVPAAGITAVGVRPDQRRRGILSALMRRQLDDVRAGEEPVAILWASEGAIYQRFGYGLATLDGSFEAATSGTAFLRESVPEGRVRIVTEQESHGLIPRIYEAMRTSTPGAVSRSEKWWTVGVLADPEYSRQGLSEKFRVVYEVDGAAEGYAIYRVKQEWDHLGPKSVLEVRDAVATTPRALRAIWRYLFDMDLVRTVKAFRVAVPNPLQHVLAEPRALGLRVGDGLWARLVDLPAALAARRYATSDELVLQVADAFCSWNDDRWLLRTSGAPGAAKATVEATTRPADLSLDTSDLAAAYLGGSRLPDLAAAGRVVERTPDAIVRAERLFRAVREPWCGSMF